MIGTHSRFYVKFMGKFCLLWVKGTDPKFWSKIAIFFFLLKKHPQVCGKYVPKF